jgi:hypothetical protein
MLPDLRFLVCGVLFCFLLFAVTGAGVRLPDARTRIGEMPEIGRPMMQRSMAEAPAQAQLYMMTVARRTDALERLREQAEQEAAAAPAQAKPQLEPDHGLPKSAAVTANPATTNAAPGAAAPAADGPDSDSVTAEDAEAPVRVAPGDIARDDRPSEAAESRIAALALAAAEGQGGQSAVEGGEPVLPRFVNVPLPQPRPAFFGFHRRAHLLRRKHRVVVVVQRDLPAQGTAVQGAAVQSLPGQAAQGAVVQGWQAQQGAVATTSAAESVKR